MQAISSYYNTNHLTGEELKQAVKDAKSLEKSILLIFQNSSRSYSPSQVLSLMQRAGRHYPITSVRRAMTNLTYNDGPLIKSNEMVKGICGSPEHKWILKQSK